MNDRSFGLNASANFVALANFNNINYRSFFSVFFFQFGLTKTYSWSLLLTVKFEWLWWFIWTSFWSSVFSIGETLSSGERQCAGFNSYLADGCIILKLSIALIIYPKQSGFDCVRRSQYHWNNCPVLLRIDACRTDQTHPNFDANLW